MIRAPWRLNESVETNLIEAMAIYQHAKKAGNPADVWKHFVLLTVLEKSISGLRAGAFHYLETHAGAGVYPLGRLGEWRQGIGRVLPVPEPLADHPYFRYTGDCSQPGVVYPGSWRLAARLLTEHGVSYRMSLFDRAHSVRDQVRAGILAGRLPAGFEIQVRDGYKELEKSQLADLTLIDPPYRPAQRDWLRGSLAAALLSERGGDYLLWYPIFWPTHPERLVAAAKAPAFEVHWRPMGRSPTQTLKGCGLVAGGRSASTLAAARPRLEAVAALLDGELVVRG